MTVHQAVVPHREQDEDIGLQGQAAEKLGEGLLDVIRVLGKKLFELIEDQETVLGLLSPLTDQLDRDLGLFEAQKGIGDGSVLRQLLGQSAGEVGNKILTVDPQLPSAVIPELPPGLDAICMRALEKQRERRYPDVRALLVELICVTVVRRLLAWPPHWRVRGRAEVIPVGGRARRCRTSTAWSKLRLAPCL